MLIAILALSLMPEAPRATTTPATGVTKVVVIASAGSLKVNGRGGATEIKATGTAYASTESLLEKTQLVATRSGSQVTIEAQIPETTVLPSGSLDFDVSVPANVAVEVRDGSGSIDIDNVASVDLNDGSGSIEIENVSGSIRITDGSGSIDVKKVGGSVTVTADGSGSVSVADVKGDFTVGKKGSGHIDYERVSGKVNIPRK